jgi:hypothetical protein
MGIHNQETFENSEKKWCQCWKNYMQTAKEDDWTEYVSCRKWLHGFCSSYKDK